MRRFTRQDHVLYFAENRQASVHYVPNINWEEYLKHRYNIPELCIIFDRVDEAEEAATNYEEAKDIASTVSQIRLHCRTARFDKGQFYQPNLPAIHL